MLPGLLLALLLAAPAPPSMARILVERDGVVAVTGADLARAGFPVAAADVARLRLRNRGDEVPVLVRPRGAGFELSFLARFLRGEQSYEDPYSRINAYVLDLAPPGTTPARLTLRDAPVAPLEAPRWSSSSYTAHFESNRKLIRFTSPTPPPDTWFWEEVKATDAGPTRVEFPLDRAQAGRPFRLKLGLMGYSSLPADPDHTVDIAFDDTPVGQAVWDGEKAIVWETVVSGTLEEGANRVSLQARGDSTNGIDLVLLDWIEITYARENLLDPDGQAPLQVGGGAVAELPASGELLLYEARHAGVWRTTASNGMARVALPGTARGVRAVARPLAPRAIVAARPADLAGGGADLVIVTHPALQPAAERLAAFRRKQGLAVRVARIDDVYDRFSHSIVNPEAIRDFLRHAYQHWSPRPRYALFFGDASWDYKNLLALDENYADWHWQPDAEGGFEVPKNQSTPYQQGPIANDRNLVPTFQWQSPWGHAASDGHFAQLAADDSKPVLALGRIPVLTLAEAQGVVDKLIAYDRKPGSQHALFISDPYEAHQVQTDTLVEAAGRRGYDVHKLYAKAEDNETGGNARTILDAFDGGEALVTFAGHGGRYIWRTGPPDPRTNHDLFTMDHLDQLKPGAALPVVISLTCYSAPFDHPAADSIGEKLLRVPDRGAIAVVASSWRNAPPFDLALRMIEELGRKDAPRIGDAFLSAMRGSSDPMTLNTYNLLGDPSTPYRGPGHSPGGGDDARQPKP